jgi:hypothetical protein
VWQNEKIPPVAVTVGGSTVIGVKLTRTAE